MPAPVHVGTVPKGLTHFKDLRFQKWKVPVSLKTQNVLYRKIRSIEYVSGAASDVIYFVYVCH